MMDADEPRTVGEYGLDLQEVYHIGDPLHNVGFGQYARGALHNLLDGLALAGALQSCGDDRLRPQES